MMKPRMQEALNQQINAELYSSYLYISMEAYFAAENLPGAANWMRIQAQEEMFHAMKMFAFVNQRDGRVALRPIAGPPTTWESPLEVFEEVYKHEQHVTSLINDLVKTSIEESDFAANSFLQWFVNEQVEEEANAVALIHKLKRAGDNGAALLLIDNELATRVFTLPADPSAPAP